MQQIETARDPTMNEKQVGLLSQKVERTSNSYLQNVTAYFVHTAHVSSLPLTYLGQGRGPHMASTG